MASKSILRAQVRKRCSTPAICAHHPVNKAVFVCTRPGCNEAFTCMKCVTTNHKGHEMEDLADFAASKKKIVKNKIKTGRDNILTILLDKINSTEQKIAENKTKTRDDQDKIMRHCNDLKAELDKICQKYTELCKKTEDENDRKLTKHKECLETLYSQYKAELEECESAIEEGSDSDIVLADREFPTSPRIPNLPITGDLKFRFKVISSKILEDWFGELFSMKDTGVAMTTAIQASEQGATAVSLQNIQQMSQFVLKRNTSYTCSYIYPTSDQLYVWFSQSRTISFVNKHGNLTNTVTLQPGLHKLYIINNVCVSPVDGTLWSVCNDAGTVQQVTKDGTLLKSFTHKFALSICVTGSHSVLVGDGGYQDIKIFTTSGKFIKTIEKESMGASGCPYFIAQCQKTGRLAITDYKAVSVLDEGYRHLYTIHGEIVTRADNKTKSTGYKPKEQFNPYMMCFDKDGDLLVSDDVNYNVTMFNSSGQYIRTIIQETDKNKRPRAVNTAADGTLWVAQENDVFKQIKYK